MQSEKIENQKTDDGKNLRGHQVKVMLNDAELATLDSARGRISRAKTFRFLLLSKMPAPVPALNAQAWTQLSKAAANLNQIARRLNFGDAPEIEEIHTALADFRSKLLGD